MESKSSCIEKYILECMLNNDSIKLSRAELANRFNCSPSQINYVLSTRFTHDRGFLVQSKRGGSGCINLMKIVGSEESILSQIYTGLCDIKSISYNKSSDIIYRLVRDGIISDRESMIISASISDKSLMNADGIVANVRVNILISIILELSRRTVNE